MNPVGREPGALLERKVGSRFLLQGRDDLLESKVISVSQVFRKYADDPPVIPAFHREEKMKSIRQEIDVQFAWNHRSGCLGVSNEKHVFIGSAGKGYPAQFSHRAARAVAPAHPLGNNFLGTSVGELKHRLHIPRLLKKRDKLRSEEHTSELQSL